MRGGDRKDEEDKGVPRRSQRLVERKVRRETLELQRFSTKESVEEQKVYEKGPVAVNEGTETNLNV